MIGKVVLCVFFVALAGCATVQVTNTARSSIEERLLISSLERALAALSIESLQGKTVAIDFYGLTSDKDFAKEFCTAWLRGKQVHLATDAREADLRLKIFAPVLGVDQGGAFVGVPSVTVPVLVLLLLKSPCSNPSLTRAERQFRSTCSTNSRGNSSTKVQ